MISALKGTVGIIQNINTTDYTATVQLPEYENQITEGLQILSPITFGNKITSIPKVNTPVFCIFIGDDTERGFIIGSYFSEKNVSNSQEDQGASLTIKEDGNIELKGTLTKIDSEVLITGDTTIEKSITVSNNATIKGSMKAEKGFETNKATLKEGKLDVESIEYKEMTKK